MDDTLIVLIENTLERATPGPWITEYTAEFSGMHRRREIRTAPGETESKGTLIATAYARDHQPAASDANWKLMAACREWIPAILGRIKRLESENRELRRQLNALRVHLSKPD